MFGRKKSNRYSVKERRKREKEDKKPKIISIFNTPSPQPSEESLEEISEDIFREKVFSDSENAKKEEFFSDSENVKKEEFFSDSENAEKEEIFSDFENAVEKEESFASENVDEEEVSWQSNVEWETARKSPTESRKKSQGKKKKVSRIVMRVLLILLLCVIVVLIWINRENLAPDRVSEWFNDRVLGLGTGEGYPVGISGNTVSAGDFSLMDGNLAVVSDTSFVMLNHTAKELVNRQHSFGVPVLKTSKNRALLYHLGSYSFTVESRSRTERAGTLEQSIFCGDIASNGVHALVTDSKGYRGEMTIYAAGGEQKYKYYFSEYYITDIALNEDGTRAAVCGISAQNGGIVSAVYVFSFDSETPVAFFEWKDNLLYAVEFMANGTVFAVGDEAAVAVNPDDNTEQDFSYEGRSLTAFDIDPNNGAALSLSFYDDGRNCAVILLDLSGTQEKHFLTRQKITSVSYRDGLAAALSNGVVYGYTKEGEQKGSWSAGSDAKKVLLISYREAYILGISEIRLLPLD